MEQAEFHLARRARIAVSIYFGVFGALIGTWAPHIPLAKERLQADAALFGLSLLCMGGGAVISMPMVGWLINRFGSAIVTLVTATISVLLLYPPFVAGDLQSFALSLFFFGATLGSLDVAMNAHGLAVEHALRKPVMSSFHGLYGVAALCAGALAALLMTRVIEPHRALVTIASCLALIAVAQRLMLPAVVDKGKSSKSFALPTRHTLGLGLLCFLVLMIELSVIDWAGIYLREARGASSVVTSLAFAAFSGCLAFSRLIGDRARARWGSAILTRYSAFLTAVSLALAILVPDATLALIMFGLTGFFVGPIAPILFAGGGRAEPENPGRGIAAVTTLGYLGSVVGPPLVGFIASSSSLAASLLLIAAFALVIGVNAKLARAADGIA